MRRRLWRLLKLRATPEDIEAAAAAKTVAETAAAELVALEGDLEAEQVAMGQK